MSYNELFKQDGYLGPLSADGYSAAIPMGNAQNLCVQCVITAGAALDGYTSIQLSNDASSWAITGSETRATVSTNRLYDIISSAGFARLKWRKYAGTGSAVLRVTKKR